MNVQYQVIPNAQWSHPWNSCHCTHCSVAMVGCLASACTKNALPFNVLFGLKLAEADPTADQWAGCCVQGCASRTFIREAYGIEGEWQEDCCFFMFCPICAYVQTAREVDVRGRLMNPTPLPMTQWQHGLCECECTSMDWYSCCCPMLMMASTKSKLDKSDWVFSSLLMGVGMYNMVRKWYGIEGSFMRDMITVGCCPGCAANRLRKEVKQRGPPPVPLTPAPMMGVPVLCAAKVL